MLRVFINRGTRLERAGFFIFEFDNNPADQIELFSIASDGLTAISYRDELTSQRQAVPFLQILFVQDERIMDVDNATPYPG